MAFTIDSKVGDILKKPGIKVIIEKHVGTVDAGQLQMVSGMTLQQVAAFVNWNKEKVDALLKDLNT
jgi:hypothetical protein